MREREPAAHTLQLLGTVIAITVLGARIVPAGLGQVQAHVLLVEVLGADMLSRLEWGHLDAPPGHAGFPLSL